ncbi:DUF6291 domain-containing protein [Clostridia bacterium OttesenSCG-928-O13]|nr:DUF6291 domain-containing protein [Clostridia bacterium OttesenSCG-928-O13]
MPKTGLILYYEYRQHFSLLTKSELGELVLACMDYDEFGTVPSFKGKLQMAFSFIKMRLDFDNEKYQATCERNKSNGKKGGRPLSEKPKKPTGLSGLSEKPKKPDTDSDSDIEGLNTTTATTTNARAEQLTMLVRFFEDNGFGVVPRHVFDKMGDWLDRGVDADLLLRCMEEAAGTSSRSWNLVDSILRRCETQKITNRQEFDAEKARHGAVSTGGRTSQAARRTRKGDLDFLLEEGE